VKGTVAAIEKRVEEPSSLGVATPTVAEELGIEPVPPSLPQAPQVSHWFTSSILSISVAPAGTEPGGGGGGGGGGFGGGFDGGGLDGAGVGVVDVEICCVGAEGEPPQDSSPNMISKIKKTPV
jgi:hypothetical protein